jgi:hypothetical protein
VIAERDCVDTVERTADRLTPLQLKAWLLSAGGVAFDGFDLFIMGVALPLILDE